MSRQVNILFATLQDKGCRLAAYTRGYCAVIYEYGSIYYDVLASITQDILQMPNFQTKGGKGDKGACIPMNGTFQLIGANAVTR
mgnify:FL=1